jgi:hypothetical protein
MAAQHGGLLLTLAGVDIAQDGTDARLAAVHQLQLMARDCEFASEPGS